MKNVQKYWQSFLHWKGWGATGRFFVGLWKRIAAWPGWKKCFPLPFYAVALISLASAGALIWVFVNGLENWLPAYFLYAIAAYCLTALCVQLPGFLRSSREWISRHPKTAALFKNEEFRFKLSLYFEQFINFAYGIFKIAPGVILGSAWIGCDGIYNMTQALIQLFQILRRKKPGTLLQQWKSYRFCGVLILLMHLTLTGIVFQMVNRNRAEEQGQIMVIATAAFTFISLPTASWTSPGTGSTLAP